MFKLTASCLIIALLLFLYSAADVAAVSYGRCESQFNSKGTCVQLADCPFIVDILSGDLNTEIEETLRKSQCGYDNTFTENTRRIMVCCPEEDLQKPPINTRTGTQLGNELATAGECGTARSIDRIYGGDNARIIDYPWMALLRYRRGANVLEFLCGGSLINSRYVLTAAHCLNQSNQTDERSLHSVRLGEWDLRTNPDCEVDIRGKESCAPPFIELGIERAISHPKYVSNSNEQFYDIALLRLEASVTYSDFIRPICLPVAQELYDNMFVNSTMEVAGWGATDKPKARSSPVKMAISVRIWETNMCHNTYKSLNRYIDGTHHLCAGGVNGIDTCRGDSGGPLMLLKTLNYRIVYFVTGIISFGPEPCGFNGWPGVYTRVGNYIDWVKSMMEP
ncbi:spaetzle-processing enzyme-like isoform X1 [Anastrepha obliqua]|uniref:spaetzle-processing enzyme-like isoform X1 n=1 Tax=Anastrepha obliqua TaxID=95512 RepID=UPI002409D9B6|nr:spaetzle-processing enzyme-like isoform X1 [Anastrepha obliqua]